MAASKSNATITSRQSTPALPRPTEDKTSIFPGGQTFVIGFSDEEKSNLRYWRLRSDVNKLEKELADERDKRNQFEAWAKGLLVGDEKQLPMPIHLRRFEAKAKPERYGPLSVLLEMWQNPKCAFAICALAIAMRALGSVALLSLMTLMAYVGLVALSGTISCWMYKALGNILFKTEWEHPFRKYLEVESLIPCGRVHAATAGAVNWLNQNVVKLFKLLLVQDIVESAKFGLRLYVLSIVMETGGPAVVALTKFDTILLSIFLVFATRLLLEVKRIGLLKKMLITEPTKKDH